jgi:hypothetical protein
VPLGLVVELCDRLRETGVVYCHWKSTEALHLSATGVNDLDLLVDRRCLADFVGVLASCGFKQARPAPHRQIPGCCTTTAWTPRRAGWCTSTRRRT